MTDKKKEELEFAIITARRPIIEEFIGKKLPDNYIEARVSEREIHGAVAKMPEEKLEAYYKKYVPTKEEALTAYTTLSANCRLYNWRFCVGCPLYAAFHGKGCPAKFFKNGRPPGAWEDIEDNGAKVSKTIFKTYFGLDLNEAQIRITQIQAILENNLYEDWQEEEELVKERDALEYFVSRSETP